MKLQEIFNAYIQFHETELKLKRLLEGYYGNYFIEDIPNNYPNYKITFILKETVAYKKNDVEGVLTFHSMYYRKIPKCLAFLL